ncbi:MAG: hypothetical protein QOG41_1812 [Thermoleophilaceae bacterium]|nr:hypothetical protein [Thermoleophilaceae bacterium]MEA2389039.1 hypothetical protein [Thermoleophilaceae bacterium]
MFQRLNSELGKTRVEDMLRAQGSVAIRPARRADADAIERLAQLETAERPQGEMLLAERDGEVVAALPLDGGRPLADPFRRTAGAVELLALRARQLRRI